MIKTGNPTLDHACEMLDRTGANWDRAFKRFNDDPSPDNMKVFKAAQQAYHQAQRTYLLAVTVSRLPLLPAAIPASNQEYIDATPNR